jgi:hypothetical protein
MDTATEQSIPVCQDQPLKQLATHEGGEGGRKNTPLPVGTQNKPLRHRLSVPQFSPPKRKQMQRPKLSYSQYEAKNMN